MISSLLLAIVVFLLLFLILPKKGRFMISAISAVVAYFLGPILFPTFIGGTSIPLGSDVIANLKNIKINGG